LFDIFKSSNGAIKLEIMSLIFPNIFVDFIDKPIYFWKHFPIEQLDDIWRFDGFELLLQTFQLVYFGVAFLKHLYYLAMVVDT
jgi:hypothetical protein